MALDEKKKSLLKMLALILFGAGAMYLFNQSRADREEERVSRLRATQDRIRGAFGGASPYGGAGGGQGGLNAFFRGGEPQGYDQGPHPDAVLAGEYDEVMFDE